MSSGAIGELKALAQRIATGLEGVERHEYRYRLARAYALALCDALDELPCVCADSRPQMAAS